MLPSRTTRYYASLAESRDPDRDPIAAQFVPRPEEEELLPYESSDPLADGQYRVTTRLIHHYRDRALLLVNDRCASYCRHCFRRHFTGGDTGRLSPRELEEALGYLEGRPEIQEILLSGGDPLMLPDGELDTIIRALRGVREDFVIRIATRVPVVQPRRITRKLASVLAHSGSGAVWIVIQANHPRELTEEFREAIARLLEQGLPVVNQSVLLKGVNDRVDVLEALCRGLLRCRVKPYYLFQGDLAAGTAHFRTSIERGLDIMEELAGRISNLALPRYAVDLPGGAGKMELTRSALIRVEESFYVLRGPDGREHYYPKEDEEECRTQ